DQLLKSRLLTECRYYVAKFILRAFAGQPPRARPQLSYQLGNLVPERCSPSSGATSSFWRAANNLGRPFIAPPDMPAERIKMLRDAFKCHHGGPPIPRRGLIRKIYATPKPIVEAHLGRNADDADQRLYRHGEDEGDAFEFRLG